jgi:hypothetical protein
MWYHIVQMIDPRIGWWQFDLLSMGFRISEALWVATIAIALWRRTWYHAAVALVPAGYLGVHLLYAISTYYPRHVVAGHLAMPVSLCLTLLPSGRDRLPRESP